MAAEKALVKPDPAFAAEWFVEDPLAQGALKLGSVLILDRLDEAHQELRRDDPDLGDWGSLGGFPRAIRPALTPLLVEKMKAAAVIVGWKLAQPGTPIQPGCLAEELALEMIRQEAIAALELDEAPPASVAATRGVYEVCEDDDVLDLFEMEEPSDAAIARFNPINIQAGKADMRVSHWFDSFYGGSEGHAPHPLYSERPAAEPPEQESNADLTVIEPTGELVEPDATDGSFRVNIRIWDEDWLELDDFRKIPPQWLYYLDSPTAGEALHEAMEQFPNGARQHAVFDGVEELRLEDPHLVRVSIDVQAVDLSQEYKAETASFYVVGALVENIQEQHLGQIAGYLADVFPAAVLARYDDRVFFGVTVNAESHEEADADLSDALDRFGAALGGEEEELVNGSSCGSGKRDKEELLAEVRAYALRGG